MVWCGSSKLISIRVECVRMLLTMTMMLILMVEVGGAGSGSVERETVSPSPSPSPKAWPEQFHAVLVLNNTKTTELQIIDLWYDWTNGRNLNLIQHQLGNRLYDVEWNNGTSYYYSLGGDNNEKECRTVHFDVGILRPNWLDGATYVGQRHLDGFLCNVWYKADFIWYYEDVLSKRPVHWLFYTGRAAHVMTFEVGAVLEDSQWQAPAYCFDNKPQSVSHDDTHLELPLLRPHPLAYV